MHNITLLLLWQTRMTRVLFFKEGFVDIKDFCLLKDKDKLFKVPLKCELMKSNII